MRGEQEKMCDKLTHSHFQNPFTQTFRQIYTSSLFARSSLLYLQEVGKLRALSPHVSSRENLNSYLFFLVTDGVGSLTYRGETYLLKRNDCVFIDCHNGYEQGTSRHQDENGIYDELWSLSWVHFNGSTMAEIYGKYRERGGIPVFSCDNPEKYKQTLQQIFEISTSDSYVRDMQIAGQLTQLLSFLMEDAWNPERGMKKITSKRLSIQEIKTYIEEHFPEKMALEILSERFFVNKYYLAKIFKEQYGFTVNAYISHIRITRAKELLRFSQKSVEEIGRSCGFQDANYFARCFKRIEGISPTQYRESW